MSTVLDEKLYIGGSFEPLEYMMYTQKIMDAGDFDPTDIDNFEKHRFRIIEGYANTPGIDRVRDKVVPDAFAKSLSTYMKNPVLRYNHQQGSIIGRVLETKITEKGLWVKAQVFREDPEADRIWKLILQGGLRAFSVYGIIKQKSIEQSLDGKYVKHVSEFDLHEIAIVDIPANSDSLFQITKKSVDDIMTDNKDETIEKVTEKQSLSASIAETDGQAKEVGNEKIGSENTILTRLSEVLNFQQKQLEVMVTFAETQNEVIQKLMNIENASAKTGEQDFMDDGEDDFEDGQDGQFDDGEDDQFDEGTDSTDSTDNTADEKSMTDIDIVMKKLNEIKNDNDAKFDDLNSRFKELTAKTIEPLKEEIVEDKTAPITDVNVEEAVQKAVKKTITSQTEEIAEKSYENAGDRLFDYMNQSL